LGPFIEPLPYILSANVGGVVEKLGEGVTSFSIGDEVFGQRDPMYPTPDSAGLQEYAFLEGVTMDDAVTSPINATTSFEALFHSENGFGLPAPLPAEEESSSPKANIDPQAQTIVIIGGGSSVGRLGIQFARLAGIGRIITVAPVRNEGELRSLGATHAIDRHDTPESIAMKTYEIIVREDITHVYDRVSWDPSLSLLIVSKAKKSIILTLRPSDIGIAQEQGLEKCQIRHLFWSERILETNADAVFGESSAVDQRRKACDAEVSGY
jgi:NADPH2:quinone reductase